MPEVSILVTVHNREDFLEQTLLSILQSTHSDFEVILVDDCSSDHSLDVAHRIGQQDDRIHIHRNDHNIGDYPNRIKAASLASGRYLKYVDSDDLIYPYSLAIMVESMQRYPDAALGLSHSMPEDDSPYPWQLKPQETYRKHFLGRGCLSCGPSGAIIRREAFEAAGGFNPEWKILSDVDLWYRLAAQWQTILLPPALVWWRRHEGQEFTKNDAHLVYLQQGYEVTKTALLHSNCPMSESEQMAALSRNRQHLARRLLSLAGRKRKPASAWEIYRQSDLTIMDLRHGFSPYR